MSVAETAPVVVGVDGSEPGRVAIRLAVREARLHQRRLRLVHAFEWPLLGVYVGPSPEGPTDGGLAAEADRVLAEARDYAVDLADNQVEVSGEVVSGAAVPVLLQEAADAAMVVLGDRGLGGFTGLLVGSVAVQMAAHAPGRLLVARGQTDRPGPVVVGFDGSDVSREALDFACAEAVARDADVIVFCVWWLRPPSAAEQQLPLIYDTDDIERTLTDQLEEAIAPARQRWPQLTIHHEIRRGRASQVLVEASRLAQLAVVGARGRGGFTGLLLGSVSQALLHHADCPVAIIRSRPE